MGAFISLCHLLGGITAFAVGLRLICDNLSHLFAGRARGLLERSSRHPLGAVAVGGLMSAVTQSSTAVNVMLASMVAGGGLPLINACAMIVGTNMGTTVTAQLVSLGGVGGDFSPSAVSGIIGLLGLILPLAFEGRFKKSGNSLVGFCLIFLGADVMSRAVSGFYGYSWFRGALSIKSPPICLLNGFFLTAICQSSSVVTAMLVILSDGGLVSIKSIIYYVIGANVGSCMAPLFLAGRLKGNGLTTAIFNLVFNLLSAVVAIVPMAFFGEELSLILLTLSKTAGGACAAFHTLFNVVIGLLLLPLLKPLLSLSLKIKGYLAKTP